MNCDMSDLDISREILAACTQQHPPVLLLLQLKKLVDMHANCHISAARTLCRAIGEGIQHHTKKIETSYTRSIWRVRR